MGRTPKDYTGEKIGMLTVVQQMKPKPSDKFPMWLCHCECGEYCVKSSMQLKGRPHSCGCLNEAKKKAWNEQQKEKRKLKVKTEKEIAVGWKYIAANKERWAEQREKMMQKTDFDLFFLKYRCPHPIPQCRKSANGTCCWDCQEFETCENVCHNSPAKCGWKDAERMYKKKMDSE